MVGRNTLDVAIEVRILEREFFILICPGGGGKVIYIFTPILNITFSLDSISLVTVVINIFEFSIFAPG